MWMIPTFNFGWAWTASGKPSPRTSARAAMTTMDFKNAPPSLLMLPSPFLGLQSEIRNSKPVGPLPFPRYPFKTKNRKPGTGNWQPATFLFPTRQFPIRNAQFEI
jgi:hypothetical protein